MIVGFSLQNVEAGKKHAKQGNLNIRYEHNITGVEQADVPGIDDRIARIRFTFNIAYTQQEEDVASIDFDGTVLWQNDADDLIQAWEDSEELDDTVSSAVANHIFRKCLSQAVGLADTLELPSPVPMPQIGQN